MVEGYQRLYPRLQQPVHQAVVETEPLVVDLSPPRRQDPGPGDREPEGVDAELAEQPDVLRVAVVEIARHGTALAVADVSRRSAKTVPDALPPPVLGHSPFELVGRRRHTPDEVLRERCCSGFAHPRHANGGPVAKTVPWWSGETSWRGGKCLP